MWSNRPATAVRILLASILVLLGACSAQLPQPSVGSRAVAGDHLATRGRAAAVATRMIGTPYRYGGHDRSGFDCSGLVYYSYRSVGAAVPRTSREQYLASRPLALERARPGDLVFFRTARKISHVGIYLGGDRFVHAPATGKAVEIQSLRNRYYARHFLRAGRIALRSR